MLLPGKDYTQDELYEALRRKITADIPKLHRHSKQIAARIGATRIRSWLFVTPVVPHNDIHVHARRKEKEARGWECPILDDEFTIFIQDAEHYAVEFEQYRRTQGEHLSFGPPLSPETVLPAPPEKFQQLIDRKNRLRLHGRSNTPTFERDVVKMNEMTETKFIRCDRRLADIEKVSPQAFRQIVHVIGRYAEEMEEFQYTSTDEPHDLVERIKAELSDRLVKDPATTIGVSDARHLADLMVSRWLAVCQLDFTEN
ncbi:hypothetical protein [Paraburkholderia sediminicola]|uniref:hypothetical protein n=1 Tax=Paraburkholderia sediminicola TaxID=458836 RepID=UPI0038B76B2E